MSHTNGILTEMQWARLRWIAETDARLLPGLLDDAVLKNCLLYYYGIKKPACNVLGYVRQHLATESTKCESTQSISTPAPTAGPNSTGETATPATSIANPPAANRPKLAATPPSVDGSTRTTPE